MKIQQLIKELNDKYPKYKFNKSSKTVQAEAIINVRCKEGVMELAYYGGVLCGYIATGSDLGDIEKYIKEALPEYKVIDFIDNNRKAHFEIFN